MKHYLITTFLLALLSLPSFAQLSCDNIDEICQMATQLVHEGKQETALKGLYSAKIHPAIRNCSDVYKIDDLISQIQKEQASIPDATSTSSQTSLSCPDSNHPHLIDLGLPSGTKWACCNVGASRPEDYGGYYAWGETTTKSTYDWANYKWCRGAFDKLTKYCTQSSYGTVDNKTVLEPADDTARASRGGSLRMPTYAQCKELLDKCTHVWTTVNGVSGRKFTGPNGFSIFLPAAGWRWDSDLIYGGSSGYYWSSTLNESYTGSAYGLNFNSGIAGSGNYGRYDGRSVRPVSSN